VPNCKTLLLCCFFGIKIPTTKHETMNAACNVANGRIKDVDELRLHILTAWDELDWHVIDRAARQWRMRLCACVKAKDGNFKHKLS